MIRSFADPELERLVTEGPGPRTRRIPPELQAVVIRKITYLHRAVRLDDLRAPPANRLERLKGDLDGFFSIRVNDRYRLVFRWVEKDAVDVALMDYH